MRILIFSDTWLSQVNGVVRTLDATKNQLIRMGHTVEIVSPEMGSWRTLSAPSYPSVKLEFFARSRLKRAIEDFNPDCIHIATEGPLGWAARNMCLKLSNPFTTSYHTRFPEYLSARVIPILRTTVFLISYAVLRRFHAPSSAVMVATASIENELRQRKFRRIVRWTRGVDTDLFRPDLTDNKIYEGLPRPILLYVGRVAVEKNIEAFLSAKYMGTKIVIGDGPDLEKLKKTFPNARFLGAMSGEKLAQHYAAADLFVFPSTTDTFGLVLLEAAASGLRIASYPAPGPIDIFANPATREFAVLDENLEQAISGALALPKNPDLPRKFAEKLSWEACTLEFVQHLQAQTPQAIKRITRLKGWMKRWWQRALALTFN